MEVLYEGSPYRRRDRLIDRHNHRLTGHDMTRLSV